MEPSRSDRAPASPTSWRTEVATALLTGVVTARWPSQRWSRGARWALHGGMGTLAAAGTGLLVSNPRRFVKGTAADKLPAAPSPALVVGAAAAVGLAVAGVSRSGQAADAWVERRLTAQGVRRPRLWMGVAAAGLSLGMGVLDRRRPPQVAEDDRTVAPAQDSDGPSGD
ncbi:MAG TPA: hypothetical protein VGD39_12170 [Nocardioides sp.]|jgi:hypothetical protein